MRQKEDIQAEKDFLEAEDKAIKANPEMNTFQAIDFITAYCENHILFMGDFLDCKMNPYVFHALMRYRVTKKDNSLTLQDVEPYLGTSLFTQHD